MKIAAFNVKNLGWKKVNNKAVRETLIKIVSRYDVIVLLEVMDESGKAMNKLLEELNKFGRNKHHPYDMIGSNPRGHTSYKEKFVFFYREDEAEVIDADWEDDETDRLSRTPFSVLFKCPNAVVKELVLIPVHTKPEDAERELDAVADVVEEVKSEWKTTNIMILGDFNADGRYLSQVRRQNIRLANHPYDWLIGDDVDTMSSSSSDQTYDRIVVYGQTMKRAIVPDSANIFNFQTAFRLSKEKTLQVSDHYPVEVELKTQRRPPN